MIRSIPITMDYVETEKTYRLLEYKCRCKCGCGHVSAARERGNNAITKYAEAELCRVCYFEDGNGHEREGLCEFPGCDEVVRNDRAKYCEDHGALMRCNSRSGRIAVQQIAAATPALACGASVARESRAEIERAVSAMARA